jgi:hypothetical protein
MNLAVAVAGALALAVTAAGCGSAPKPSVQPDLAGKPTWGACSTFSEQAMSIAEGARGAATLKAAVADYREDGDRVVRGPSTGGLAHRWLVDDSGTIHADLGVWHSGRGWFVTGAKRCAG